MHQNRPKLLSQLSILTPPQALSVAILVRVQKEKRRAARIRLAIFGLAALSSLFAFIPLLNYAGEEFSRSGTALYFSLILSDGSAALLYWKEFMLSIVESLPLFGLTVLFATFFIFLGSLRLIAQNIRTAFLSVRLA